MTYPDKLHLLTRRQHLLDTLANLLGDDFMMGMSTDARYVDGYRIWLRFDTQETCFARLICLKGKIKNKNCFIGFALMAKQPEQSGHENWSSHQGFTNRTGP
jgi:hypothetical protein